MQEPLPFPSRSSDQHCLMERMASARVSEQRAREIIASPEAHRQFMPSYVPECHGRRASGREPTQMCRTDGSP